MIRPKSSGVTLGLSKPSGDVEDKALSYVSKSPADMVYMLERWKKAQKHKSPFILQEFVDGIELAVGGWFGPGGFNEGWCENFEFKKLMPDDLGPATGEQGTVLNLHHAFSSAKIRDHFVQGWRHQLALFSKTVAEEVNAVVTERVDAYLRAWGEPDGKLRRSLLESCATPDIVFRDAFSATDGLDEMLANLEAVQIFMPGMTLLRAGDVRLSHGTAIADWTASAADGSPRGKGTNVYDMSPDGLIARVIGYWGA